MIEKHLPYPPPPIIAIPTVRLRDKSPKKNIEMSILFIKHPDNDVQNVEKGVEIYSREYYNMYLSFVTIYVHLHLRVCRVRS